MIRRDHPRLFFNAETWPAVKARAFGAELDRLLAACDKYPSNPKCSGTEPAPPGWSNATPLPSIREWGPQAARCALAWRFTGKPEYLEKAKRMLTVSVAAYGEAYRNRRAVNWYTTTRILALCAYDWIYEALTPEERRAIIVPLVQHVEDVQPGKGKPHIVRRNGGGATTGCYGVPSLLWYSGVAADGDGLPPELLIQDELLRCYDRRVLHADVLQASHHMINDLTKLYPVVAPLYVMCPQSKSRTIEVYPSYYTFLKLAPAQRMYFADQGVYGFLPQEDGSVSVTYRWVSCVGYDGSGL